MPETEDWQAPNSSPPWPGRQPRMLCWGLRSMLVGMEAPQNCTGPEGVNLSSSSFNMRSLVWRMVAVLNSFSSLLHSST